MARTQNKRSITRPFPGKIKKRKTGQAEREATPHRFGVGRCFLVHTMHSPVLHTHPFTSRFLILTECDGASVEMCHASWGGANINIYNQAIRRVRPPTDVGTYNTSAPRRPREGETESENYQPNESSGNIYSNPHAQEAQCNRYNNRCATLAPERLHQNRVVPCKSGLRHGLVMVNVRGSKARGAHST